MRFFIRTLFYQLKYGTVHWDTKISPNNTGNEKVDRLPVIVSQESGSQFLDSPIIADGTGAEVSEGVIIEAIYLLLTNRRYFQKIF